MDEFIEFLPVSKWPLNFEEAIFCRGLIKPIVEKYKDKNESINEIFLALSLLATLSTFSKNNQDLIDQFREYFLNASRDCLLEELNRLANQQKNSHWEKKNKQRLAHTRYKNIYNFLFYPT